MVARFSQWLSHFVLKASCTDRAGVPMSSGSLEQVLALRFGFNIRSIVGSSMQTMSAPMPSRGAPTDVAILDPPVVWSSCSFVF
jgi:hypothetical protein